MTLEQRIEQLERRSSRWRTTAYAFAALTVAALLLGNFTNFRAVGQLPPAAANEKAFFIELPQGWLIDLDKLSCVSRFKTPDGSVLQMYMNGPADPKIKFTGPDADAVWAKLQRLSRDTWTTPAAKDN